MAYCRKNVAKYAMPYDIEFKEDMPKTLVGKVAYRQLEEEELAKIKAAGGEVSFSALTQGEYVPLHRAGDAGKGAILSRERMASLRPPRERKGLTPRPRTLRLVA